MNESYAVVDDPTWPWLAPYLAALLLFSAVYSSRQGKPFSSRVVCAVLLIVMSIAASGLSDLVGTPLMFLLVWTAAGYDNYLGREGPDSRRRYALALISTYTLAFGWFTWHIWTRSGWQREAIVLSNDSLKVTSRRQITSEDRAKVRVVEFNRGRYREWHIKDGVNNESISDGDRFIEAGGLEVTAFELVQKIEQWSGRPREHAVVTASR